MPGQDSSYKLFSGKLAKPTHIKKNPFHTLTKKQETGTLDAPKTTPTSTPAVDINDHNLFFRKYQEMLGHADKLAKLIRSHKLVKVVTHIDADGISSGAIAAQALQTIGKDWTIQFEKQLDPQVIKRLHAQAEEEGFGEDGEVLYWFTDFGSGQVAELQGLNFIIADHHVPAVVENEEVEKTYEIEKLETEERSESDENKQGSGSSLSGQTSLFDFPGAQKKENRMPTPPVPKTTSPPQDRRERELNPHFFDLSGADHISGAGVTYLVAKALSEENRKLAPLAILGAVGDLQDTRHCRVVGLNEFILEDAREQGLQAVYDIRSFGRETRPIFKLLQYSSDPIIPGITGDKGNAMAFMVYCKEPLADNLGSKGEGLDSLDPDDLRQANERERHWKCWVDLSEDSRKTILSNLMKHLLYKGIDRKPALRLLGEVYSFGQEEPHTPVRDAKEFATLLNACGRYGNAEIGFKVCCGDRGRYYDKALLLLQGHRRVLVDNIKYVQDTGVTERDYIQWFHGHDVIPENVVGIVAGMVLGSGEVNEELPMIGFTNSPDGIKVSGRTVRRVVSKGVNLARALNKASKEVGGGGGGHNIAAGAHIPKGKEEVFLGILEDVIKEQIEEKKS